MLENELSRGRKESLFLLVVQENFRVDPKDYSWGMTADSSFDVICTSLLG